MYKKEEEQYSKILRYIGFVLLGGLLSLIVSVILILICAFAISSGWISDKYMMQYTIALCTLGSFIGSVFSVRCCGERLIFIGIGSGIVFFLLLLSIGFLFFTKSSIENHGVLLVLGSLIGGALAGTVGRKRKKKRRK